LSHRGNRRGWLSGECEFGICARWALDIPKMAVCLAESCSGANRVESDVCLCVFRTSKTGGGENPDQYVWDSEIARGGASSPMKSKFRWP
jgi:hypothetical protein